MIPFASATLASAETAAAPAETERLGDEIARLAAHLHAATYRLLVLIRTFDEREGWSDGFRSCAHWLSWRTGIAPGAAREKVRVARALASLPLLSAAMERGALSFSKARALTRVGTPDNEAALAELAAHATAAHIEAIVRAWRRLDRLDDALAEAKRHESRRLDVFQDEDGMFAVRGRLEPEVGALLEKALAWAEARLYRRRVPGTEPAEATFAQRRADAAGLVAEYALAWAEADDVGARPRGARGPQGAGGDDPAGSRTAESGPGDAAASERRAASTPPHSPKDRAGSGVAEGSVDVPARATSPRRVPGPLAAPRRADRFQVVLHVGGAAPPAGGLGVSAETSRRLACDAGRVVMTHDATGRVLDVGRRSRTVPSALRRALDARDRGCRFPGCGLAHVDAHHITHWVDGGPTSLDNLVLLCRRHHRAVHEQGWSVRMDARGEPVFRRPDGRVLPDVPPSPNVPREPTLALARAHRSGGVEPDAWTTTPDWHGERLDLGFAIDMLREG